MPQKAWSTKRERQYEHIKNGLLERGEDEDTAEEIAARTVNKERARAGESEQASRTSTEDISSGRRGGTPTVRPTSTSWSRRRGSTPSPPTSSSRAARTSSPMRCSP